MAASLNQDWPVAEKKFGAALTAPVKLPEASFGRGVALYHLGNYLGAGVDFAAATEALPRYGLAFLWTGKTWERRGNREEARQAYLKAAAFNPDVGEAWYRLGIMAYEQGHLSQAQEYLEKAKDDFGQAARREWLAETIGVSKSYLSRIFKLDTSISLWDYINRFRIQKARERLFLTDASITEIAADVGYDDVGYFGRVFREVAGCSPRAYRLHARTSAASGISNPVLLAEN